MEFTYIFPSLEAMFTNIEQLFCCLVECNVWHFSEDYQGNYLSTLLFQSIQKGPFKLCDFGTKVESLKISWLKRLVEIQSTSIHLQTQQCNHIF